MKNVVCLIIDGLAAGALGPYGNSWIRTPACNRLAAEGFLFDQAFVDSSRFESVYRSLWTGSHALVKPGLVAAPSFIEKATAGGINTLLVTDDPLLAEHPMAQQFRESLFLRPPSKVAKATEDVNTTELALFFAEALDQLGTLVEPFLLWVHSRGMTTNWDAPWAMRQRFLEEEDEETSAALESRLMALPKPQTDTLLDNDPDEQLLLRMAYAAQVEIFDLCLGAWQQALRESPFAGRTLLSLSATRSYPLGQHNQIGMSSSLLHEELIHIPWIIRLPDGVGASGRSAALVQPADLPATLLDWLELVPATKQGNCGEGFSTLPIIHHNATPCRDRILITDEACINAIRTSGWYLICEPTASDGIDRPRLYLKPDDRWEVNEVADRCPQVTSGLTSLLSELQSAIMNNDPAPLGQMDANLRMDFI